MGRIMGGVGLAGWQIVALGASVALALGYLGRVRSDPGRARSVTKAASVAILGLIAAASGAPLALVTALMLSAVGDWCLSRDGEAAFLAGIAAFGAAHIAYVTQFLSIGIVGHPPAPLVAALAVAVVAGAFLRLVLPGAGVFRWPVAGYAVLIGVMVWSAVLLPHAYALAMIGAVVFMISDMMIAVEKFRPGLTPRARAMLGPAIWLTYYPAQVLILLAFLPPLSNPGGMA